MNYKYFIIIIFLTWQACDEKDRRENVWFIYKGTPYPYPSGFDLESDSIHNKNQLLKKWAGEEILFDEALSKLGSDPEIEEKTKAYRKKLYIHELEQRIIENNIDTAVSSKEIQNFYALHAEDYLLSHNIVRLIYVRIPAGHKMLPSVRKKIYDIQPNTDASLSELREFATAFTDYRKWISLDDIKKNIPFLKNISNDYLTPGKTYEFTDKNEWVYCKILDRKNQNTLSPLSWIKEDIKKSILRERAQSLLKAYREQIYEDALKKGDLIISINSPSHITEK